MKTHNDSIGNRTHDLSACKAVPRSPTRNYEISEMFVYLQRNEVRSPEWATSSRRLVVCGKATNVLKEPVASVFDPEGGGNMILQNIHILPECMESCPKRQQAAFLFRAVRTLNLTFTHFFRTRFSWLVVFVYPWAASFTGNVSWHFGGFHTPLCWSILCQTGSIKLLPVPSQQGLSIIKSLLGDDMGRMGFVTSLTDSRLVHS
jgi:hypothetical protein